MDLLQSWRSFSLFPRATLAGLALALFASGAVQAQTTTTFTVTAGPASVTETDANADTSNYTITRSGAALTAATTTVTWTVNHAATKGTEDADFGAVTGMVDFAAGDDTGTFTLNIVGDSGIEGDEYFSLSVSASGHTSGDAYAVVLIDDEVSTFTVTAGPTSIAETDADAATSAYTITRSGAALPAATTVTWTVNHAASGGTSDADFTAVTGMVSFAVGVDTGTFTLTIVGDNLAEGDESFELSLSAPGRFAGRNYPVTITDDETVFTVTGPATLTETDSDDATGNYTITRSGGALTAATTTVTWTVNHDTTDGTTAADFMAVTGTVDFAAGEDTQTFTLTIVGDNIVEDDEGFELSVSATGHGAGANQAVTISDDDSAFTVTGPSALTETDSDAATGNYTITRSGAELTAATTSVTWTVNHNATEGTTDADFMAVTGSVDFAAGDDTQTFTLTIVGDNEVEGPEGFELSVSATGFAAGDNQAVTITDDDTEFTITAGPASVTESDTNAATGNYTITRSGAELTASVTVTWMVNHAASNGTSDADFDGVTGTETFAAGDDTQTFVLTIVGDNLAEGDENFSLSVSASGGHTAGGDFDDTITDDDSEFTVTSGPNSLTETDSNAATSAYTITRSGAELITTTTVTWMVVHDGASGTDDDDFVAVTGTVDFASGDDSETFTLTFVGDNEVESIENFDLSVSATGHTAGANYAVTVDDDDSGFEVSGPATLAETDADAPSGNYTIGRIGVELTASIDVTWTIMHNSADGTNAADFAVVATTGVESFAAGDDSHTFSFTVAGDNTNEGDEGFTIALSIATNPAGHSVGAAHAVTITDDDDDITFVLAAPAAAAEEGSAPVFSVTYMVGDDSTALASAVTLTVDVLDDVPEGHDFGATLEERAFANDFGDGSGMGNQNGGTVIATAMVTIPAATAHNTAVNATLPAVYDDDIAENVEHYRVRLTGAPSGATVTPAFVQHTIAASDPIMLTVVTPTNPIMLTEGGTAGSLRVNFDFGTPARTWQAAGTNIKLRYTIDGGNTAESGDITWASIMSNEYADLSISAGSDDTTLEAHVVDAYVVTGTNGFALNTVVAANSNTVTILDDDARQWVITAREGGLLSQDVAETAMPISGPNLVASNDDTMGLAESYLRFFGFGAGGIRAETTISYCLHGTATGGTASETGRDYTWPDGYDATIDATGDHADCQNGRGAAIVPTSNPDMIYRIPITLHDDDLNEGDETIIGRILGATIADGYVATTGNVDFTTDIATRTIKDNDDTAVSISIASSDADDMTAGIQVAERRSAEFTVTLTRASSSAVTVPYTISGGVTAADLTGITSLTGNTFEIAAGQTNGILAIPLEDDADTAAEDLTITLDASGYMAAGTIARTSTTSAQSATVSVITRTEARSLTLTRYTSSARTTADATTTVTETDAGLVLYYRIGIGSGDTAFTSATTVTWTITHGSTNGTVAADFSAVTGTVDMTDMGDFTVTVSGDNLNEANEQFSIGLSVADNTADSGTNTDATTSLTINDDDAIAVAITSASANVSEGGDATITVDLGAVPSADVMVAYTFGSTAATDDVDAEAADYTDSGSGSLTISANTDPPTGSITIGIAADNLNEAAETFTVSIADSGITGQTGSATIASGGLQTFTIAASDPVTVSIAAPSPATVNEAGTATFAITLTGASAGLGQDLTLAYTVGGNTEDTPTDAGAGSLTLAAGATTSGSINIGIPLNTMLDEMDPDQMLTVTLDSISGGGGGSIAAAPANSAEVTVQYRTAAHTFSFTSPTASITEGTATATTYTVTRSGPAIMGTNIVVAWTYTAGTAAAADFVSDTAPAGGNLTYTGTETSKTFTVTTKEDTLNEPGETFTLGLMSANAYASEGGVTVTDTVAVTITDDDPVNVAITADAASAVESGTAAFTVTLSGGTRTANVVVPFSVSGLDAAEFAVTAPTGGSITFDTTDTTVLTAAITVNLVDDALNEASKTLSVTGGTATSAGAGEVAYTSGGDSADVTVTDDDTLYAHLTGPTEVDEGDNATFTVTLRTGTGASDPVGQSADMICLAFNTEVTGQQTTSPARANDATSGADIALVAPNNGTCAARTTAASVALGTGVATGSVEIPARTASGMATFQINAVFDNIEEGATDETLAVSLTALGMVQGSAIRGPLAGFFSVQGSHISTTTAINNIDAARSLSLAATTASADEGGNLVFTASLTGAAVTTAFDVAWTITVGGAEVDGPDSGMVTFAVGDTSQAITLTATDDEDDDMDETVTVTLSDPCGPGVCAAGGRPNDLAASAPSLRLATASASGTINESDHPVTLSITAPTTGDLAEGAAASFSVGFTESVTTTEAVTATWTISFPGASPTLNPASAADFGTLTGTATIAAGQSSTTVEITATDDTINEAAENFIVTLSNSQGGGGIAAPAEASPDFASVDIEANDPLVAHIALTEPSSGGLNEGGRATYTVTLRTSVALDAPAATSGGEVCVPFGVRVLAQQPPANTMDNTDYAFVAPNTGTCADRNTAAVPLVGTTTFVEASVLIPEGEQSATFQVEARFDNIDEGDTAERLEVDLALPASPVVSGAGAGVVTAATGSANGQTEVNINNINAARTLSVAADSATAAEGGNAAFTITVSGQPVTAAFDVTWTLTGSAAAADYTGAATGTLSFAASTEGVQTQSVPLPVVDDALNEGPETLILTLTDPCPSTGTCAVGGRDTTPALPDDAPSLQLTGGAATITIGASDPISVTLARRTGDTGRLVNGDAVNFVATLGATASPPTPPDPNNPNAPALMLQITAMAGSTAVTVPDVDVAAGATEAAFSIAACDATTTTGCLDADTLAASGEVQLAVSVSGVTGAPTGATAAPHPTNAAAANIAMVGWELSISPLGSATTPSTVGEGSEFDWTVSLRGTPAPTELMVPWTVAGIGTPAASAADFTFTGGVFPRGTLVLSGAASGTISVQTMTDTEDESAAAEGFTVTLGAFTGADAGAVVAAETVAYAAISDALRTLAVGAVSATLSEDAVTAAGMPAATAEFTITMSGTESPVEAVEVTWRLSSPDPGFTLQPSGAGLGRNLGARDLQPGQALTGTVTFPAGTSLTPPAVERVMVPIAQDALNEGAERLRLTLDTVDPTAGGRDPNTDPGITGTLVSQEMAEVTVAASDAMTIFLAPPADQGTLVSGGTATYTMSFGTTTVNGVAAAIVPTTDITVQVDVTVGGATTPINVPVSAGATTAEVVVRADEVNPSGQTGSIMVAVGTPTGLPAGATAQAGTQAQLDAQPDAPTKPAVATISPTFTPQQTAGWGLDVAAAEEAPEGSAYSVVFTLTGDAAELSANGLTIPWSIAPRTATGGRMAEAADFAPSTSTPPAYTCGAVNGVCATLPSGGPVTFTTGDSSQTLEIRIRDDGDNENMMPDGFTLTLGPLGGADAPRTQGTGSLSSTGSLPLEVTIPALRADLSVADATAAEGANAVFALTLANFTGGSATTSDVTVTYRLGGVSGDTATPDADYTAGAAAAPSMSTATIAAGATSAAITIPLLPDGLLESRETFTLTIIGASGGGGSIRLTDGRGNFPSAITATGTITDDADQNARRQQRVGALVAVLDRQTAIMATDAITARLERNRAAAGSAELSIANRNLLGGGGGAQSAGGAGIGLALYGAAGLGGATAGLPGGSSGGGASGVGAGASAGGGGNSDAFAGLGAGLAGGANMGSRTALPSLAELMNGSSFAFQVSWWPPDINFPDLSNLSNLVEGVQIWGSGGLANLDGNPHGGGATLDYDGDNLAFFIGADRPVGDKLLAGFALGWASGDLDFTDSAGAFRMDGNLSNDMLSLHPYLGWQVTPNLNAWLVLGFGFGSVDISENEGSGASRISRTLDGGDSNMLMFAAGFAGRRQFGAATDLKLRFEIARVRSDVDSASFSDGAHLPGTQARSGRIGGELELGHRFTLANGISLRPFGSLGLRFDNNGSASAKAERGIDEAFDAGVGVTADWPEFGLDGRFAFSRQINNTGHEEQRLSVDLNFDPGADSQGLTLAVQTALSERHSGLLSATSGRSGLGSLTSPLAGASGAAGSGVERSISGELGYGMAMRQFGRAALLTPYGRFNLGDDDQRWAAGLRLAQSGGGGLQLGIEAGLDLEATRANNAAPARSYDLLLTGQLRF